MKCGEKIAALRRQHGMTQEALGKAMNVSYQAVSKWERDESQPDFDTVSKIAKLFGVPLGYFEDGGEALLTNETPTTKTLVGTCTECGRVIYDDETFEANPKLVCGACAEKKRKAEEEQRRLAEERRAAEQARREAEMPRIRRERRKTAVKEGFQRYTGLTVGLAVALALCILFTVLIFTYRGEENAMFYGLFLFLTPMAGFAAADALINALAYANSADDGPEFGLKISLIVAACFAGVMLAIALCIYFLVSDNLYFLIAIFAVPIASFTFVSQFLWDGVVKSIFTCGGITFKLPMILFELSPDGIIALILTKLFLGLLAVLIFLVTTVLFAVVAMLGSVILFIPSLSIRIVRAKREKAA